MAQPGWEKDEPGRRNAAVPWTDLAYALTPNGRTLDYVADAPFRGPLRGDEVFLREHALRGGLRHAEDLLHHDKPELDPRVVAGSARSGRALRRAAARAHTAPDHEYHSSYYINHSQPPAPLLIANGWTDDLFPVDEALRYYNRTKTQYPKTPVSLFFFDCGHPRAQNKDADKARYVAAMNRWLDYYLKGVAASPSRASRP